MRARGLAPNGGCAERHRPLGVPLAPEHQQGGHSPAGSGSAGPAPSPSGGASPSRQSTSWRSGSPGSCRMSSLVVSPAPQDPGVEAWAGPRGTELGLRGPDRGRKGSGERRAAPPPFSRLSGEEPAPLSSSETAKQIHHERLSVPELVCVSSPMKTSLCPDPSDAGVLASPMSTTQTPEYKPGAGSMHAAGT